MLGRMNEADWLRKRWKHRFHGCSVLPGLLLVGGGLAALVAWLA